MKAAALIFAAMAFSTLGIYGQSQGLFIQDVSWSADGKYLAFTGMHDIDRKANTLKADIYVVKTDGTDLKKITGDQKNEFYTAWTKGRIVFSAEMPGTKLSDIYIADPDGSNLKQLTSEPGRNTTPTVSQDGRHIAFVSTRDGEKYQIYVMNFDGSSVTRLTKDSTVGYFNPQFSPDGKRILYYAEKGDGKDQVWVMNADGSNPTLLTADIGHNIFPGWSPDGKRIIFSSSKRDTDSAGSYVDGSFLYTMNADGSSLAKLGNIKSFFARFSPNGKKIAYVSGKFPATAIYIANADGTDAVQITK
jgi:Tol biopolymer transport system component